MSEEVEKLVGDVNASIEEFKQKSNEITEGIKADIEENGKLTAEMSEKLDASAKEAEKLADRMVEIEQQMAEGVQKGTTPVETLGQSILKTESFKDFQSGKTNKFTADVQANTITGQEGSPAENTDTLVPADRLTGIVPLAYRALRISDVLPQGTTNSNSVEYTKELSNTNNAAETAEGATKPESEITYELADAKVRTIAHWIKASKQVLEDSAALESHINTRMRHGILQRLDSQLLNGDGTGQNISGMAASGNNTAFTPVTGEQQLDSVNRMIQAVIEADYAANAVLLNPADWHAMERLKDTQDRYLIGDPNRGAMPILWGLPVVVSNAVTAGKAMVADFNLAYQQFNRSSAVVEMFEQDDTNVQQNLLTIRAELRATLATYVPAASQYGDLGRSRS